MADVLAKHGSDRAEVPSGVFVQELTRSSIKEEATDPVDTPMPDRQVMVVVPDWTQVFTNYIRDHKLLADKVEVEQVTRRSKNNVLVDDKLYHQGASSGVLLKCITPTEGKEILEEIHVGCCGNHATSKTLDGKAFRSRYNWPAMLKDGEDLVHRYKSC